MTELLVENIIVTTQLHQLLDLSLMASVIPNSTYDENEQSALIITFDSPKRAMCILPNGQLFCTSITSLKEANEMLTQLVEMLKDNDIFVDMSPPLTISMMTVSTILEQPLNLELVEKALQGEVVYYNPNQAPWLEYSIVNGITLLIFPSGKIILTGTSSLTEIEIALMSFKDKLSLKGVL
jgi:TATA-box binding protein (TBP) (component of TFIID and TFIIIB)